MLLAEIYSQALDAAGYRVERALGLGPREFVGPALSAGLIAPLPECAGTALIVRSLGRTRPCGDVATPHDGLVRARHGRQRSRGRARAELQQFVVTAATAERYDFDALSDLAAVAGELSFCRPPECERRRLCLVGLRGRHGLKFADVVRLDAGGPVTHATLRTGRVDVALFLSTDPRLSAYAELDEDRRLQPAENVTPLLRREVVDRWDTGIVEVIDAVSHGLDTETLRELNAADAGIPGTDDIAAIAAAWLRSKELP